MTEQLPEADIFAPDYVPELVDTYHAWLYGDEKEHTMAAEARSEYEQQFLTAYEPGTPERKYHATVKMTAFNMATAVEAARQTRDDDLQWLRHRWQDDHQDWHQTQNRVDGLISEYAPVAMRRLPYFVGGAAAGQGMTDNPFIALAAGVGSAALKHGWDEWAEMQVAEDRETFEDARADRKDQFRDRRDSLYQDAIETVEAAHEQYIEST